MTTAPLIDARSSACVLAVDVDDLTLGRVKMAVRGTELVVRAVSREEVLDRAQSEDVPVIVLIEWKDDEAAETTRLCEALRRAAGSEQLYIVALGGPADHAALLRATEGPANDALSRPFDSELLLICLTQALRIMRRAPGAIAPHEALDEALQHGSGEVCVRSGDTVARIHVQANHIVWANVSSAPATMEDVVAHGGVTLEADVIKGVKHECRTTGAHFMDILVQWGIIERDRAREAVRTFVTERVKLILDLPDAEALFLPSTGPRAHSERLRFRPSEIPPLRATANNSFVLEPPPPESRRAPALSLVALADVIEAVMKTDGAIGAAVLERGTGTCLHYAGAELDTQIAWSQLSALAALGPDAEEVLASAGELCFVTRPLRSAPSLMLFVCLASAMTSLGLARATIAAIAGQNRAPGMGSARGPTAPST